MKAKLTERGQGRRDRPSKYVLFDEDCRDSGSASISRGGRASSDYGSPGSRSASQLGSGRHGRVTAARDEARRLIREIDRGVDPLDVRKANREAPTFAELAERYIDEHLPKLAPTNRSDQISCWTADPARVEEPQGGEITRRCRSAAHEDRRPDGPGLEEEPDPEAAESA